MPRNTKADRILLDAEMRLEAARIRQRTAQSELNTATATLDALQEAYDALKKELTPTPRKKSTPRAQSISAAIAKTPRVETGNGAEEEKEDAGPLCGTCGNIEGYQDHHQPSPNYHPFESSAKPASKKSSRKGTVTNSTPNSEGAAASAMSASSGGD